MKDTKNIFEKLNEHFSKEGRIDDQAFSEIIKGGILKYIYLSIYRLSIATPTDAIDLAVIDNVLISLMPGPFQIQRSIPIHQYGDGSGGLIMGTEDIFIPEGAYMLFQHELEQNHKSDTQANARIVNSEILALLDLKFEGLIGEKVFEIPINKPGQFVFSPESPIRIYGIPPITEIEFSETINNGINSLNKLEDNARQRFRLMSRWLRRANDTLNLIDKFLFLYFAVEVYPSFGTTDVPRAIRDFLHQNFYSDITKNEIKDKLMLGKIAGFRSDIVHNGRASILESESAEFTEMLERLYAIAFACMRYLASEKYSGALDKWLHPVISDQKTTEL